MDPSIVKLLEEDEDETMHSGADVDAFTAALNRDIEGDNPPHPPTTSTSQPPPSAPALSQGTNHTPSQLFQQWQSSKREEEVKPQTQEQQSSPMEMNRYGDPPPSSQPQPQHQQQNAAAADKNPIESDESQLQRMQRMNNQQRPSGKQVPFAMLLPVIEPQLDKDRAMQLQNLYLRLKSNNINKEEFVRHMRSLVGDHMLKMAVFKLQQQGQHAAKQSSLPMDNVQKQRLLEHQSDSHGIKQERDQQQQPFPMQQQQHMPPFPHPSFTNYGNMSSQSFKHDLQMRQGPIQSPFSDMKRLHGTHFTSSNWQPSIHKDQSIMGAYAKQDPLDQMHDQQQQQQIESSMNKPESMSITAQLAAGGGNAKTPPKKPTVGQKKPLEAPVSSISKKQKVSGAFSDQSIEQLNDVTAVSGVNLREEEEQLFSGSKEDSRVSEASRKVVQEEEERLILQKTPLQKKLAEIMAKCGVKSRSNDVEKCLSLCVEERMRGLISNLIRLSKQRVDVEKPRHKTVVTSDVRKQIMSMNQKARDEWEKKQADAEKLQRADDPEGSGDGEDGRGKSSKVNKDDEDKNRTTAANVAARAAVGGDDMLSKWQLMAEQARQKREGGPDAGSASQPSIDVGPKPQSTTDRISKDNPDTERIAVTGPVRKITRNQQVTKRGSSIPPRTITVKDVISVLGREVQMSRSTLIYRLYEKMPSDSVSD